MNVRSPATFSVPLRLPGARIAPLCSVVAPTWPAPCSSVPLASVSVPPSLPVDAMFNAPACTNALPVYALPSPDTVSIPVPVLVKSPLPAIAPARPNVVPDAT
ncbi:hypothetical protein G6F35_018125 [Rhizopus arrhizus]|nr:hypothetical protein G6F35_018125 [Rhizopus arrhizus]